MEEINAQREDYSEIENESQKLLRAHNSNIELTYYQSAPNRKPAEVWWANLKEKIASIFRTCYADSLYLLSINKGTDLVLIVTE